MITSELWHWIPPLSSFILAIFTLILLYLVGTRNHNFFSSRNIPFAKPSPFLGNSWKWLFGRTTFFDMLQQLYKEFERDKVFGLFEFMDPIYVIKDMGLVKQICVTDFDSFVDRRMQFNEGIDPLFANALFAMRGTKWRNMRAILSPAFTGSKMRRMFGMISEYSQNAGETLDEMIGTDNCKEFQIKDIFIKMSSDITASCAFGCEMNVLRDGENEFFREVKHLTRMSGWQRVKFLLCSSFPRASKAIGLTFFDASNTEFMRNTVRSIIEYREKNNIVRQDMVHLLMQARDQELKFEDTDKKLNNMGLSTAVDYTLKDVSKIPDWTLDDIVSQCTVFIFGGLDTVSNAASFLAYELALNPIVQKKLHNEIDQVLSAKNGEPITYEDIQSLVYMDRVVTETLRKWPQALFIDRKCTKAINLRVDDKIIPLKRGDSIWIPALPLQRDPKYFPDPEKFDPDRFAPDRHHNLDGFVHLAFGVGPRNCLGNRFALMEIKTVFFWLLSRFEMTRSIHTEVPLQIGRSLVVIEVKNGIFVNLKKRNTLEK